MTEAQHTEIVGLLRDIRDALAWLCQPVDEEADGTSCDHPTDTRTDFSTPREVHWVCGVCSHVERRQTTRAPALQPGASAEE